ncbi:MAG: TatD family hydrolase [Pseudomonadota bacterium]|nr:TatD family hydrolase [Pseudomonadota bacterium]
MLIDSHCHLDFPDFACERDAVIERARAAGLKRIITISTRTEVFGSISLLAETYDDVFCTAGTHPHYAHEETEVPQDRLVALARHPKCVGIGEAGLDYHYDKTPRDIAARVFRTHIAAARQSGLPIVIHVRDADADIAVILRDEMGKGAFAGVLHCFTSSAMLAEAALSLGLYISFSGVLTFKNSRPLREIARAVPMDRMLVETDAPYLAPVPYRGKRNEPAFVAATAQVLADVNGVSPQTIAAKTSANALRLFSKMPPPPVGAAAA